MKIHAQITREPILPDAARELAAAGGMGALAEFTGIVRAEENGKQISALEYEAYDAMALRELREILSALGREHPFLTAVVVHRVGIIPVGEAAIYLAVGSRHRGEAFAVVTQFMDRLKQRVPVWKRRGIAAVVGDRRRGVPNKMSDGHRPPLQLEAALAEINSRCQPLPGVRVPLNDAIGRVLCETICATEDLPSCDRSTRDGYAILQADTSENFQVVDTLHAADWKPRQLRRGETVRVATGAALPCDGLRVVMQEHIERAGDTIKITRREAALNVRRRGEDMKAGQPLVPAGARLDAGKLALLATAGCAQPLVSPKLRVLHFTTGDELVPPDEIPRPGQIRDSNSILVRALLAKSGCEVKQVHLPEDFELAKLAISTGDLQPATCNLLLVSGGASVGDKDFTRPLLEWLGFEIIFTRLNLRPGAPLIFGVDGPRAAFGLPGNPLSHFVCFHLFVAAALTRQAGTEPEKFLRGRLAAVLAEPENSRETWWPARLDESGLVPLAWASSGDVTCLAQANALIRLPANGGKLAAGAAVEFLPV
jgi:molybdopterin molybdotransferase